ncbi:MAG: hypothetical protein NXI32_09905 [bacterium]|nr:hypothetical protein [bacterium]
MTRDNSEKLAAFYNRLSTPIICSLVIACCLAAAFAADAWSQQAQGRAAKDAWDNQSGVNVASTMQPTYVVQDVLQEVLAQPASQFQVRPGTAVVAGQASEIPRAQNQTRGYAYGFRISESEKLAAELRRIPESERDEAKTQRLRELLLKEFDSRQQQQVERLEQILAEAKRAGEILDQREAQKDQIIERRITELLGGKDPMNWDYAPGLTSPRGDSSVRLGYPLNGWDQAAFPFYGQAQIPQPAEAPIQGPVPGWNPAAPPSPSFPNSAPQPAQPPMTQPRITQPAIPQAPAAISSSAFDLERAESEASVRRAREAEVARTLLREGRSLGSASDVISLGYQIQQLQREADEAIRLSKSGLIPQSELAHRQGLLEAAKQKWDFRRKEYEKQLQVVEIDLRSAMQQLESSRRLLERFSEDSAERLKAEREILEAEKAMLMARLEAETVQDQLNWMKDLQVSIQEKLNQASQSAVAAPAQTSDAESGREEAEDTNDDADASDNTRRE